MSYTPGPWETVTTDEDITTKTIIDENNFWIARVLNFDADVDDIVESKANARLIASAPDLLTALKALLYEPMAERTVDAARRAIAKAEKG